MARLIENSKFWCCDRCGSTLRLRIMWSKEFGSLMMACPLCGVLLKECHACGMPTSNWVGDICEECFERDFGKKSVVSDFRDTDVVAEASVWTIVEVDFFKGTWQ